MYWAELGPKDNSQPAKFLFLFFFFCIFYFSLCLLLFREKRLLLLLVGKKYIRTCRNLELSNTFRPGVVSRSSNWELNLKILEKDIWNFWKKKHFFFNKLWKWSEIVNLTIICSKILCENKESLKRTILWIVKKFEGKLSCYSFTNILLLIGVQLLWVFYLFARTLFL